MKRTSRLNRTRPFFSASALTLAVAAAAAPSHAQFAVELDEFFVRVEINASDGDVGAHFKLDGEGWKIMRIANPLNHQLYRLEAQNQLEDQGQTENFSESTEPLCFDPTKDDDPENDDEEFQTLNDFLERFIEGEYRAAGRTNDDMETIGAVYELEHKLPAAPDISLTDGRHFDINNGGVVINWRDGDDFGNCSDEELGADDGGLAPTDEIELWEVTVEPADEEEVDDAGLPFTVFTMQVPADQTRVRLPRQYFLSYLQAGIEEFQFEVGGKANENLTFSEGEFTVEGS